MKVVTLRRSSQRFYLILDSKKILYSVFFLSNQFAGWKINIIARNNEVDIYRVGKDSGQVLFKQKMLK